jgi:pantoate--beta-alanine ligase
MEICRCRESLKKSIGARKREQQTIGFVPTMGALHEGHLSLVRMSLESCDVTVCSIFVNPRQFNDQNDYRAYEINLERDAALLEREGVDLLFAPDVDQMYPRGFQTVVQVEELSRPFEGAKRPGHFTGVTTVVSTLLGLVAPDCAIFGEKDFQQLRIVEQMVGDLGLDVTIVRGPLIRDESGLALSSRNERLSESGRREAQKICRALREMVTAASNGERVCSRICSVGFEILNTIIEGQVEYLAIVDEVSLCELTEISQPARILVVVQVEGVRLLDNMRIEL